MHPIVECKTVWKRYGAVEALKGVDLTIQPGEVVAILGPNGAGKTTCMSLMLGLRQPSAGEVRLFGLSPSDRRARSRCGVMLQDSGVSGVLTVRELVHLFQAYYPTALPTAQALAMAGLQAQAGVRVATLSGGQLQRLYFALAVCGDPDVLFLDEPTVGMDVEARRAVLGSLQEWAGSGKTIVFTTHYLKDAEDLARRIVVIDRGLVIVDAPPQQLKAQIPARRVTFRLSRPLPEAALQGLDVTTVEVSTTQVRFLSNAPELALQALFQRGVECHDLEVVGADLEEAFLALTERRVMP